MKTGGSMKLQLLLAPQEGMPLNSVSVLSRSSSSGLELDAVESAHLSRPGLGPGPLLHSEVKDGMKAAESMQLHLGPQRGSH